MKTSDKEKLNQSYIELDINRFIVLEVNESDVLSKEEWIEKLREIRKKWVENFEKKVREIFNENK
jgi:hypothetical protein